jgi:hypothetical protein
MRGREAREDSLDDCWVAASMSSSMMCRSQSRVWRGGMKAEEEVP